MFLQAFIAFIFGSIVMNVAKWQVNNLARWYMTRHFRKNPPQIIEPGYLVSTTCTCDCGSLHPKFHDCTKCGSKHMEIPS